MNAPLGNAGAGLDHPATSLSLRMPNPADRLGVPLCIDARMLERPGTGVSHYAQTLVETLRESGVPVLLLEESAARDASAFRRLVAAAFSTARRTSRSAQGFGAPDLFRRAHVAYRLTGRITEVSCEGPSGIMHWTYPVPIKMAGWRNIYTVHDAIPLTRPDLTPIAARRHRRVLQAILAGADRLVTVSEAARAEIVGAIGCDPARVVNLGQAADVGSLRAAALPGGLVAGRFFLFCGSIEPRKNLVRLAQAHHRSGSTLPLVLAGPDGWRAARVHHDLAAQPGVVCLGYQDREALLRLLASARALLFPSLAEGFGLPVAEAMTLGTPVMTARDGALAEVAGGAALTVDPADEAEMARAIARLSADDALCAALAGAGRRRAAAFTRKLYAERLLALYAAVAHGN